MSFKQRVHASIYTGNAYIVIPAIILAMGCVSLYWIDRDVLPRFDYPPCDRQNRDPLSEDEFDKLTDECLEYYQKKMEDASDLQRVKFRARMERFSTDEGNLLEWRKRVILQDPELDLRICTNATRQRNALANEGMHRGFFYGGVVSLLFFAAVPAIFLCLVRFDDTHPLKQVYIAEQEQLAAQQAQHQLQEDLMGAVNQPLKLDSSEPAEQVPGTSEPVQSSGEKLADKLD